MKTKTFTFTTNTEGENYIKELAYDWTVSFRKLYMNLELQKDYLKPIKQIPLLSRLEKGEYQTAGSKSDKNISATIKFFLNNLPSFKQFKGTDDISWVINQDRLLIAEILQYYADNKKPSICPRNQTGNAQAKEDTR